MGYSTSNPPALVTQRIGNGPAMWIYSSADAKATVNGALYFTNGDVLGMRVNDLVYVVDTATPTRTLHAVTTVTVGSGATVAFAAVS